MVQLTTDPCIQLESFNENKRKTVLIRYKDIRIKAALEIKQMWYNLGKINLKTKNAIFFLKKKIIFR